MGYSRTSGASSRKYFLLYDLETSRTEFLGQIMTAFFQLVDESFNPVEGKCLDLEVKVSRLELPEPEALLTNRILVQKHQENAVSEFQAAAKIVSFISECISLVGSGNLKLTGYNSSRFDLPFIRTTLIRNGFNPYFKGQLQYGDAIHWMKKLAWEDESFPLTKLVREDWQYYSFKLEEISRSFHVLSGKQTHSAKEDVELLRELLARVQTQFKRSFWEEEVVHFPADLFFARFPNYSLEESEARFISKPVYLLDKSRSAALLVDLEEFQKKPDKEAIRYVNQSTGFLVADEEKLVGEEMKGVSEQARKSFKGVNLDNFFEVSDCDIEQDIYRLSFGEMKELGEMINSKKTMTKGSQDLRQLWRRFNLKEMDLPSRNSPEWPHFEKAYTSYLQSRYMSSLKLNKFGEDRFTRPVDEWLKNLNQWIEKSEGSDLEILLDLKEFYEKSELKAHLELSR